MNNIMQPLSGDRSQYLTIALTKGRLADQTMDLLDKAGYYCEELENKKSRKLIFTNEEQKLRFFLSKGPDVPTYVEYGAADIGVTGSDIIIEENRRVYEVLDLEFGRCTMCVAGPESARELLKHHERIRVASSSSKPALMPSFMIWILPALLSNHRSTFSGSKTTPE